MAIHIAPPLTAQSASPRDRLYVHMFSLLLPSAPKEGGGVSYVGTAG